MGPSYKAFGCVLTVEKKNKQMLQFDICIYIYIYSYLSNLGMQKLVQVRAILFGQEWEKNK